MLDFGNGGKTLGGFLQRDIVFGRLSNVPFLPIGVI
jgi:hypothetical protein